RATKYSRRRSCMPLSQSLSSAIDIAYHTQAAATFVSDKVSRNCLRRSPFEELHPILQRQDRFRDGEFRRCRFHLERNAQLAIPAGAVIAAHAVARPDAAVRVAGGDRGDRVRPKARKFGPVGAGPLLVG